ncbi:DEAD/DEAH box helicase family protein [Lysinibacillus sp. NPDC093216]|uniref:DEAD/DEAH box helicase family protein n=1 Tax=Lysinibacillus sp. NPDC093216 TaxID=3390576 RepID=UPI003CFFFF5D
MNKDVKNINARLSLRTPQKDSLEILAEIVDMLDLRKHTADSLKTELEKIQAQFPQVKDFERNFPSLCFAIATGVGKTRLMGAFISYLYIHKGMKNFFVLAPNLTIYNKLIQDFTPGTSKYVFKGISQLAANEPRIITGDNYDSGKMYVKDNIFKEDEIHINIFNISKINSEVRGGKAPRIKRLSEYIGESYFEYLASLPDLVLIMDESHRYRASAGIKVLNELKPVLGLELTATPQVEQGKKTIPFENVIYSYPLYKAMEDGYVKEPKVATRENFDASQYTEEALEQIKLYDGIRVHEETKTELDLYSREYNQSLVKPFVLVVAQDTDHAEKLLHYIESEEFYSGQYKNKVMTVHSNQSGEEKDEVILELMKLENPNSNVEIVIHVNMLKEGWDVTNLYTIIPLRAAKSKTLVEQSIGRGLRLPYGKRTGSEPVDRLTIIAHDNFQQIVDEANDPTSIIRSGIVIGRDIAVEKTKAVTIQPVFEQKVVEQTQNKVVEIISSKTEMTGDIDNSVLEETIKIISKFENDEQIKALSTQEKIEAITEKLTSDNPTVYKECTENLITTVVSTNETVKKAAEIAKESVAKFEYLPNSKALDTEEIKREIAEEVANKLEENELNLFPEERNKIIREVVEQTVKTQIELSIDIPRITLQPQGEVTIEYHKFQLDVSNIQLKPIDNKILIQSLRTHKQTLLDATGHIYKEERLENYIVSELMNCPDISYDDHAELLYDLAGQLVIHIESYLDNEDDVINVLVHYQNRLAEIIHQQMQEHTYQNSGLEYEVSVGKGFEQLKSAHCNVASSNGERNFRLPVSEKNRIKTLSFNGFEKCLYSAQKFDSDSERRFAVICENDVRVIKWFKPTLGQLKIYYGRGQAYNPDFVLETNTQKIICEIKRESEMQDEIVQQKAAAVKAWCAHATKHELANEGKEWIYLLVPHTDVAENMTIDGLKNIYNF